MRVCNYLLLGAASLLAACSAGGPTYQSLGKASPNKVVIYRPDTLFAQGKTYPIQINGKDVCDLKNGGFIVTDPGTITAASWDMPGTSRLNAPKGSFVKIEMRSSAALGFVGQVVGNSNGPFELTIVSPIQAKQEIARLHQDCI